MSKRKVLIVTQEMEPYTVAKDIATTVRALAPHLQKNQMEIRVLMPRYGTINERRHRLHEVVRLSGMNIIVDDNDFPLIIKVASLPDKGLRMQVYFLDNEDFFKRKFVHHDKEGKPFADNADRTAFFCKGVIETVKKFGWPPDIIHCHGWMTSLIPFYLRTAYSTEPLFADSKIVYSLYQSEAEEHIATDFPNKASINALSAEDLAPYMHEGKPDLHGGAIKFADAVIKGSTELSAHNESLLAAAEVPVLDVQGEDAPAASLDFYFSLLEEEVVK
ncbi:glycogen/starch synthase [Neolewinella lacunae]|uniref:starch synthase n=1 Tax=Neolewinella lacunae TaxID=1517758 RepID=A0A923T6Y6_9BACT|nr:glycogen/starch synthase [Neolewinella lacunae]MBC6993925.1 glycogen/starch synthase [Neolewinella lacunae]MDN3634994.1 glycogen/starch synthase [Neolewinella lacunae]